MGDEPYNLSCVSTYVYPLSCIKPLEWKMSGKIWLQSWPQPWSQCVCKLTLQLWQWFSPFIPGERMISPVGISWIFSSIIFFFIPLASVKVILFFSVCFLFLPKESQLLRLSRKRMCVEDHPKRFLKVKMQLREIVGSFETHARSQIFLWNEKKPLAVSFSGSPYLMEKCYFMTRGSVDIQ